MSKVKTATVNGMGIQTPLKDYLAELYVECVHPTIKSSPPPASMTYSRHLRKRQLSRISEEKLTEDETPSVRSKSKK